MRRISKVSGLVQKVENVNHRLSFLTISILDPRLFEKKVTIYMKIGKDYIGKWVDITTEEYGIFHKKFRQTVEGLLKTESIKVPYSDIECLNEICIYKMFSSKPKI